MRMPRALQVISTGGMYGAERVLLELSRYLNDNGWDSRVLAIDGAGAAPLVAAARRMGMQADLFSDQSTGILAPSAKLTRFLDAQQIDLVHSHGYKPDILLALTGQPRRRACIATCHSWYSDNWKLRLYEKLDKRVLRSFAHVVGVSAEIEHSLLAAGLPRQLVSVVQNGLDPVLPAVDARAAIRAQLGIAEDCHFILRVGRLVEPKGNDILLRALANLPMKNWHVVFLGEGATQYSLEAEADALRIRGLTTFCGFQPNVADYLAAADLFVSPSLQEGLPMVLLEAMAAGLPVISTSVGEIPSVLVNGRDGLLVNPGNTGQLRDAMATALSSPADRLRWSTQARATFTASFSRGAMGRSYGRLYDAVLQQSRDSMA